MLAWGKEGVRTRESILSAMQRKQSTPSKNIAHQSLLARTQRTKTIYNNLITYAITLVYTKTFSQTN